MIKVNSIINIKKIRIRQLTAAQITALEQTGDALLIEIKNSQIMPFDTGNLQNEQTFTDFSKSKKGTVSIISSTPYARRLYYHPEYNFKTEDNKNAQGRWLEPWINGNKKEFCIETYKRLLQRLGDI